MRRVKETDPAVDSVRFGDWLGARWQSEHARRVLWDLFAVSSLNVHGDDASLSLAAVVVKTGLIGKNDAADIGVPALPLGDLHGEAAARLLEKLGAQIDLNTKVAAIHPSAATPAAASHAASAVPRSAPAASHAGPGPGGAEQSAPFRIELARGGAGEGAAGAADKAGDAGGPAMIDADAVVLAVPPEQAAKLIPAGALPAATVSGWSGLGASPIVNVHVIYDRKVLDLPFAAAVNSPVQWIFDRTAISGLATPGAQYLALSQSAGDEWVDTPVAELREIFVPALADLLPKARDANVAEFFVTRERRATFRQVPGTGALRPAAATELPGLVLAGAWTATGWPDTMEGAVRSGVAAAAELEKYRTRSPQVTVNSDSLGVSP